MNSIQSISHLVPAVRPIVTAFNLLNIISYQISRLFDPLPRASSKHSFNATKTGGDASHKVDESFRNHISKNPSVTKTHPTIPSHKIEEEQQIISPWKDNFKNVKENRDLINDPFNADLEYLVKVRINNPLMLGQIIKIRAVEGKPHSYIVHQKIINDGLVSYALKPTTKTLPPLIVFRCTESNPFKGSAFSSMQNDIDPSIGERGWNASAESFRQLMQDPEFRKEGEKVKVAGYSLGGAHAQYFIAEHHASVSLGIFYNDPSVHPKIAEQFAETIQGIHRDDPLILQIFRTHGDPCHFFGGKHLGCNIDHPNVQVQLLEIDIPNQYNFDTKLHSKRLFYTDRFDYIVHETVDPELLSRKLDNAKRNPIASIFETIRKKVSSFLSGALSVIRSIFQFFFRSKSSHRR